MRRSRRGAIALSLGLMCPLQAQVSSAQADGDREPAGQPATAVDSPAWLVNSRTEVYRGNERDKPFLTLALSGALDDPNVKVGGQPLQRRKTEEPAASGGDDTSGSEPAAEEKKKSKTDQAEDLLKGLLKKLGD